jgi:hypothetical protein
VGFSGGDIKIKHEPPLNSIEWEAFMANCLADAATNGKTNGKDN